MFLFRLHPFLFCLRAFANARSHMHACAQANAHALKWASRGTTRSVLLSGLSSTLQFGMQLACLCSLRSLLAPGSRDATPTLQSLRLLFLPGSRGTTTGAFRLRPSALESTHILCPTGAPTSQCVGWWSTKRMGRCPCGWCPQGLPLRYVCARAQAHEQYCTVLYSTVLCLRALEYDCPCGCLLPGIPLLFPCKSACPSTVLFLAAQ